MSAQRGNVVDDERGASAVEFALVIPVLLTMIIGIMQIGIMFYADAGLQQAVETGARYATIYPNPSDAQILAKVGSSKFGLDNSRITGPSVSHGTAKGVKFVEVTMAYSVPMNFVFFQADAVSLSHTRRAYQP